VGQLPLCGPSSSDHNYGTEPSVRPSFRLSVRLGISPERKVTETSNSVEMFPVVYVTDNKIFGQKSYGEGRKADRNFDAPVPKLH